MGARREVVNHLINSDKMNPPSSMSRTFAVNPILSTRALCLLLLASITVGFAGLATEGNLTANKIVIGGLYGIISGWAWVTSSVAHRLIRLAIRMTLVGLGSYGLLYLAENPETTWLKYVTQLGGMVMTQCVLFHLLRIPDWRFGFRKADSVTERTPRSRTQFDIADVISVTTAFAVLLGLAIRYRTPIDPSEYWVIVFGLWILFPLLAALTAICTIPSQSGLRISPFVSLVALGVSGAWAMAKVQVMTSENTWGDEFSFFSLYGYVILGHVIGILLFGLIGRKNSLADDFSRDIDQTTGL